MLFDEQEGKGYPCSAWVIDSGPGSEIICLFMEKVNFSGFVGHMFSVTITQLSCM